MAEALFAYAVEFSSAYVSLPTSSGALLLFGAVQTTMIIRGIWLAALDQSPKQIAETWIGGCLTLRRPEFKVHPVFMKSTLKA